MQILVDWGSDVLPDVKAAQRIHEFNPRLKLIIIVRDPMERLLAQYLSGKAGFFSGTGTKLENIIIQKDTGDLIETHPFVVLGIYSQLLSIWAEYFPVQQILVQNVEDLEKNPLRTLSKAEEFLEVNQQVKQSDFTFDVNNRKMCPTDQTLKCVSLKVDTKDIQPRTIEKIRKFYEPYNEKFFESIGKFFNWSVKYS